MVPSAGGDRAAPLPPSARGAGKLAPKGIEFARVCVVARLDGLDPTPQRIERGPRGRVRLARQRRVSQGAGTRNLPALGACAPSCRTRPSDGENRRATSTVADYLVNEVVVPPEANRQISYEKCAYPGHGRPSLGEELYADASLAKAKRHFQH